MAPLYPHTPVAAPLTPESVKATVSELAQQLGKCSSEDFKAVCISLAERVKQVSEVDAPALAEAVVGSMRMYFGHDGCVDRCWPLVGVLDELCASKECIRPLSFELHKDLLRELLRNLYSNTWTKHVSDGAQLLRKLNMSCVMLLNSLKLPTAYNLLLDLGTDESDVVGNSLVVKCLRKLNKLIGANSKSVDQEVRGIFDVVRKWLQKARSRLSGAPDSKGIVDSAVSAMAEGVKELANAAQRASPDTVMAWLQGLETEEAKYVLDWLALGSQGGEKENLPTRESRASDLRSPRDAKDTATARVSCIKRRESSPAKLNSPCVVRNK